MLRWSFLRLGLGMKHLLTKWQVGDGREEALAKYVVEHARRGDVGDVIRVIDEFAYKESFLINVGDEKGALLDKAVERVAPKRILELGTYCGYGALRLARASGPNGKVVSVEFNADNADIARRVIDHAGLSERITVVVGTLGDGGATIRKLRDEHGFTHGAVDLVFVDHDKNAYVPDLRRILDERWLRPGSVVVADNVRFPGAPEYKAFMQAEEGRSFRTMQHETKVEYQSFLKDWVLESEYIGRLAGSA
ncbi:MAG: O-methyltransferase [Polyangiaceae bacterium]|nr:O-methyltransferase [Polyangiaceae bacterium]